MIYRYAKIDPETRVIVEEWEQDEPLEGYVEKQQAEETGKPYILPVRVEPHPEYDPATHAVDLTLSIGADAVVRGFTLRALSSVEIATRDEAETKMKLRDQLVDILLAKGVISAADVN